MAIVMHGPWNALRLMLQRQELCAVKRSGGACGAGACTDAVLLPASSCTGCKLACGAGQPQLIPAKYAASSRGCDVAGASRSPAGHWQWLAHQQQVRQQVP
jgi:hypothetical protein